MPDETPDQTPRTADPLPADECRVLDAAALKALAHPLRFRLLERLMERGPSTASELAREVGESSGSTSYHLRQLAAHELIVEAPDIGTGRDRWWRARPGGWTLEGFEMQQNQPETAHDVDVVLDEVRRTQTERLHRWHREAHLWGSEWVDGSIDMISRPILTRGEMRQMRDELLAVVDRWRSAVGERSAGRAPVPDGAVPVTLVLDVFPSGDPPGRDADGDQAGTATSP
ncbi:winged helix-turn-helix domain-containing protein [Actinomarinicola tropica]|uniref:winged helix-turn-helix domain-containing protein n=1 Tax=Actinomarinicola tropica TaxID=2789776 RepID=UPI001E413399|nr:helix-turn-helix domain-containing protein [Actinomarinicola tropica]